MTKRLDDNDRRQRGERLDPLAGTVEVRKGAVPPEEQRHGIPVLDFLALDIPPQEMLVAPWLPCEGSAMIYGKPGLGKTWFALSTAWTAATGGGGGRFLGWKAPKPRGVVYVDGEMHPAVMQDRLRRVRDGLGGELRAPFVMLSGKRTRGGIPDLASEEGRAFVERELVSRVELLVLDNLGCLVHSGAENEAESFAKIRAWVNDLNSRGVAVLLLHHAGKSGDQRGSSAKVDGLDTLMALRPTEEDTPGLRAEVRWEKWRLAPEGSEPFEARMHLDNAGGVCWERFALSSATSPTNGSTRKPLGKSGSVLHD